MIRRMGEPHAKAAWEWFVAVGEPQTWVAPLVGLSEAAFRVLCRRHGAGMAHTEMIDAAGYVASEKYREQFSLDNRPAEDHPLVVQVAPKPDSSLSL